MEEPNKLDFIRLAEEMYQKALADYNATIRHEELGIEPPALEEFMVENQAVIEKVEAPVEEEKEVPNEVTDEAKANTETSFDFEKENTIKPSWVK